MQILRLMLSSLNPSFVWIIASFEGSKLYYPLHAETHFTASDLQVTATPNAETVSALTETYILGVGIAIIAATNSPIPT
jgi:hypothetical protein